MGGINLKALLLSSILTIIIRVALEIFEFFVRKLLVGLFLLPLLICLDCLSFLFYFFILLIFPAIAAFLYYKFNDSSISVTEGSIAGACYFIGITVINMILFILLTPPVQLEHKIPTLFLFPQILYSFSPILICGGVGLIVGLIFSVMSGAIVGALFGRKKEKTTEKDWEDTW